MGILYNKLKGALVGSLLVVGVCSATNINAQALVHPSENAEWDLTFEDNFDSDTLDESKWFSRYLGFRTSLDRGNAEYTFRDGKLVLQVFEDTPSYSTKGNMQISSIQTAQGNYHQGSVSNGDHYEENIVNFDQQYGFFEVRAKCPPGSIGHSAFWMNASDPALLTNSHGITHGTEIDIYENFGSADNKYYFNIHNLRSNTHQGAEGYYSFNFSEDFHTYALDWQPDYVRFYVDGQLLKEHTKMIPQDPMFIYLSLYNNSWGANDQTTPYPREMEVDYIRVWQKKMIETSGKIEAEKMTLKHYGLVHSDIASENGYIAVTPTKEGEASFIYNGSTGDYNLEISYYDENDGSSEFSLYVDNELQSSWVANEDTPNDYVSDSNRRIKVVPLSITEGSLVTIKGKHNLSEKAAIDYVEFKEVSEAQDITLEAEQLESSGFQSKNSEFASNGKYVQTEAQGTGYLSYTMPYSEAMYTINVTYFDESDGDTTYKLYLNESLIDTWIADKDLGHAGVDLSNKVTHSSNSISIDRNDVIKLEVISDGWEYGRVDKLDFIVE